MAKTVSNPITLLSANAVTAANAGTKGAPGAIGAAGGWVLVETYEGGDIGLSITNGATGPGVEGNILIQTSPDNGATVYDYWGFGGGIANYVSSTGAGQTTQTIKVDPGVKYVRVIGWGHTVNPVSYGATFTGVVRN